jgi:hypothetical protein
MVQLVTAGLNPWEWSRNENSTGSLRTSFHHQKITKARFGLSPAEAGFFVRALPAPTLVSSLIMNLFHPCWHLPQRGDDSWRPGINL